MQYRRFLFAWPLVVFFACGSQNGPNSGVGDDVDASSDAAQLPGLDQQAPEADAPLGQVDAPIGQEDAPAEDAPSADASGDAPAEDARVSDASADAPVGQDAPADAPPDASDDAAPITVIVGGPAGLEDGMSVVFSDATGAVVDVATTGVNGEASTTWANVTMATVVLGNTTNPNLYTVEGLSPGQQVWVADVLWISSGPFGTNAEVVSVPKAPTLDDGGALSYSVFSGTCGGGSKGTHGKIPLEYPLNYSSDQQPCVGLNFIGSSEVVGFPLLVEAEDPLDQPLGFAFSKLNMIASIAAGQIVQANPPAPWLTTMTTQTLEVSGDDGGAPYASAFSEVTGGVLTPLRERAPVQEDGGVGPGTTVHTHPGFADTVQTEVSRRTVGYGAIVAAQSAVPPSVSGTLAMALPPASSPYVQTASADWATGTPVVSWTMSSGTLAGATAIGVAAGWNQSTQYGSWTIIAPGTSASSLTVPVLPASLSAYAPAPGATSTATTFFAIYGQTAVPSYPAFLPVASSFQSLTQMCGVPSPVLPALPNLGTVLALVFSNGGGC